jgi:peptidoglycan/xylan/chitin deacetylase (PgdA/CDA1 family)
MYRSNFPHGIMFHYFHSSGDDPKDQGSLSAEDFEQILLFVGLKNILTPGEWVFKLQNNRLSTSDVCITFDDGLRCQYDVCLPILEKYKIRCFWFVYSCVFEGKFGKLDIYRMLRTRYSASIDNFYASFFREVEQEEHGTLDFSRFRPYYNETKRTFPFYSNDDIKFRFIRDEILGKEKYEILMDRLAKEAGMHNNGEILSKLWLTNKQLRELNSKGHSIGLHSYDHPTAISSLSYAEQFSQYSKNFFHIEQTCKRKPIAMSHPCNSYSQETISVLKSFGILCGFRSNMIRYNEKKDWINSLEIPREDSINILAMTHK